MHTNFFCFPLAPSIVSMLFMHALTNSITITYYPYIMFNKYNT